MRRFPVGRIKDFKQEHLGILINRVLANVLRPFLEKWNGQYRVWWTRASKSEESPYEIQQKYPNALNFWLTGLPCGSSCGVLNWL